MARASPPRSFVASSAPSACWPTGSAMVMGDLVREVDVVVVGGGPGGYSAAFRCAELGLETVVVDAGKRLGGACLFEGCIPSKALLHVAAVLGGYIGLELGQGYAALGSAVTLVEMTDALLPGADRDLVQWVARRVEKQFAAVRLNARLETLRETSGGVEATIGGAAATFDRVLVAVGRRPLTEGLGLETTRVKQDPRGFVEIDARCATAEPRTFAVGDATGEPMLAHRAMRQGKVAAEAIAGRPAAFDNAVVPAVVFTDPEIAWCGLTETQTATEGRAVRVAKFQWAARGRAPPP